MQRRRSEAFIWSLGEPESREQYRSRLKVARALRFAVSTLSQRQLRKLPAVIQSLHFRSVLCAGSGLIHPPRSRPCRPGADCRFGSSFPRARYGSQQNLRRSSLSLGQRSRTRQKFSGYPWLRLDGRRHICPSRRRDGVGLRGPNRRCQGDKFLRIAARPHRARMLRRVRAQARSRCVSRPGSEHRAKPTKRSQE